MTEKELVELYNHVGILVKSGPMPRDNMTLEQQYFADAFNAASFGQKYLTTYSEMIHNTPEVNIRCLHAHCLGYAMGARYADEFDTEDGITH